MTKKHYIAIAKILMMNHPSKDSNNYESELCDFVTVCSNLADYFQTDNKNFDRARFLEACGIEQ